MFSLSKSDILRPKLIRIGNKCYRDLSVPADTQDNNIEYNEEYDDNDDETATNLTLSKLEEQKVIVDDDYDIDDGIEEINGRFMKKCQVPQSFYGIILGSKGATKRRIEAETEAKIDVPSYNAKGDIVVKGPTRNAVISATKRIQSIVDNARLRSEPSHFVSIPVNNEEFKHKFNEFKRLVLSNEECLKSHGICEEIFQTDSKLHLSIAILYLGNEYERDLAKDILKTCHEEFIKPLLKDEQFLIQIKGLECFDQDKTQVSVLYGKIQDLSSNNLLQTIADELFKRFVKSKFVTRNIDHADSKDNKVLLHLTLMNTKFLSKEDETDNGGHSNNSFYSYKKVKKEKFDASAILKHFGDYDFGQVKVNTIHISIRHSQHPDKDGYYPHTELINLD